jgi:GT2 family glycosyltransferase
MADEWNVYGQPAYIELTPQGAELPTGWVLFSGVLHRRGEDCTARLAVEMDDGSLCHFPLTVTLKGAIFELLYFPKGVRHLLLEPMLCKGWCQLIAPKIKPVLLPERLVKMVYRIAPLFKKHPYARLRQAGMHFYTPLFNLKKAYTIAGHFRAYTAPPDYAEWIAKFDTLTASDRKKIARKIKSWRSSSPQFGITILASPFDGQALQQTLDSLERQLFRNFRVTLLLNKGQDYAIPIRYLQNWLDIVELADTAVFEPMTAQSDASWVLYLKLGDMLAEHTLFWLASETIAHPEARFIYADHDLIAADGDRTDPVFKPDWSPELLRSNNYIASAAAMRADTLLQCQGLALTLDFHDLFLRITELLPAPAIRHISAILWHYHKNPAPHQQALNGSHDNPVASHLKRLGIAAAVQQQGQLGFRINYHLPDDLPKISIIIPTRDAFTHLFACVESVLNKSTYQNIELLIVDNQTSNADALAYLDKLTQHPKVKIIRFPQPFNYSRMNNLAAAQASGEVLCLLNNDTEVIAPGWLEEMLGHLIQKQVGVVGAKLYYSDDRVQHAGDTVGPGGCANHLHMLIERDAPGYCGRAQLAQDLSAVTGACFLTWRSLFLQLEGLDGQNLPVSFNDVDYCLRVRDAGFRVVWTPYAELYHYESISRGKDDSPEKLARSRAEANFIRTRWAHLMAHDPFYNPNLSYVRPDFSLSYTPMVKKPWNR